MARELTRRFRPAEALGMGPGGRARDGQRLKAGGAQIRSDHARAGRADDVARARDVEGGDR
jgi:hypothetical protein